MIERAEPTLERSESAAPLLALGAAARKVAEGASLEDSLNAVTEVVARATSSDVVLVRVRDEGADALEARVVVARSSALAAELQSSRVPVDADVQPGSTAERLGLGVGLQVPITARGALQGRLELYRTAGPFSAAEDALARLAADCVALALADPGRNGRSDGLAPRELLRLGGDALAVGLDEHRTAAQIALIAAQGSGATAATVWRVHDEEELYIAGVYGAEGDAHQAQVAAALQAPGVLTIDGPSWILQLGQPPLGVLELRFQHPLVPSDELLDALTTFAARAAHSLRASDRAHRQSAELKRSRAVVAVVGQAIAHLSLAHTLDTAIARVAELLESDRLAVYLLEADDGRLLAAAGRGITGPHTSVAERLLELARGRLRGQDAIEIENAAADHRLRIVREQLGKTGIEAVVALPLRVQEDLIGLLVVYLNRGRTLDSDERSLVTALATQLAVAVQNARLHEAAKRSDAARKQALEAEQRSTRTLRSLYEISRTFAQSLSLETTLEAIARSMAELLGLDAVGLRMPDERGEALVTRALHVRDERMHEAVRAILMRPQPLSPQLRRLFAGGRPLRLDVRMARELGGSYGLLVPFLEKGSTAAIVPASTPKEMLGTLTLLSLDPVRPLQEDAVELALSVGGQAALALENARLYQQQKRFADTMQRSLLPRGRPEIAGVDLGDVYESSARVDVGGDVYDFLTLEDGRLAVALGDVTGHGIDAAADMAMAKFVFRSLAREHPEPGDFLAAANDVVVGEVASSKFITMLYVILDPAVGEVACACAGHPPPRIVEPGGNVRALEARGLVLGISAPQAYAEVREHLPLGAAVVLFTDGVIEARRGGHLYGEKRLDAVLAANAELPANELARAVVADCRSFAGGELTDDCAVVVIRRAATR
jgi:serine phosphatase RsbU (regulator of sigma subunit)